MTLKSFPNPTNIKMDSVISFCLTTFFKMNLKYCTAPHYFMYNVKYIQWRIMWISTLWEHFNLGPLTNRANIFQKTIFINGDNNVMSCR